jgi:hypothetical protein
MGLIPSCVEEGGDQVGACERQYAKADWRNEFPLTSYFVPILSVEVCLKPTSTASLEEVKKAVER